MTLTETIVLIKELMPNLIDISVVNPTMKGDYLFFERIKKVSHKTDEASFKILIAGNSLTGDSTPVIATIEKYRLELDKIKINFQSIDLFNQASSVSTDTGLYVYAIDFAVKIYNESEEKNDVKE